MNRRESVSIQTQIANVNTHTHTQAHTTEVIVGGFSTQPVCPSLSQAFKENAKGTRGTRGTQRLSQRANAVYNSETEAIRKGGAHRLDGEDLCVVE